MGLNPEAMKHPYIYKVCSNRGKDSYVSRNKSIGSVTGLLEGGLLLRGKSTLEILRPEFQFESAAGEAMVFLSGLCKSDGLT